MVLFTLNGLYALVDKVMVGFHRCITEDILLFFSISSADEVGLQ